MESNDFKVKKRYLLIGSISELRDKRETSCILVDEDDLEAINLKDLVGVAIVPLIHAVTVEEQCDGVLSRVYYCRDLIRHHKILEGLYGKL